MAKLGLASWLLLTAAISWADVPQMDEALMRAEALARAVYAHNHPAYEMPVRIAFSLTAVGPQILADMYGDRHGVTPLAVTYPNGHIYIDQRLDYADTYTETILEHELIHALQYMDRGPVEGCQDYLDREREAYVAQAQRLDELRDVRAYHVRHTLAKLRC